MQGVGARSFQTQTNGVSAGWHSLPKPLTVVALVMPLAGSLAGGKELRRFGIFWRTLPLLPSFALLLLEGLFAVFCGVHVALLQRTLVRTQPRVCRGEVLLDIWSDLVQLDRPFGEAIVLGGVCGRGQKRNQHPDCEQDPTRTSTSSSSWAIIHLMGSRGSARWSQRSCVLSCGICCRPISQ